MSEGSHHSIGEVLSLLKEEHPDITIAKIRFLESQGLIEPERTPSGYRKFYDPDIERLRWILTQQRDNFLPLKVIKRRLAEAGFDPAAELPERDYGALPEPAIFSQRDGDEGTVDLREVVSDDVDRDEDSRGEDETPPGAVPESDAAAPEPTPTPKPARSFSSTSVSLSAGELSEAAGGDLGLIADLERLGLIVSVEVDGSAVYDDDALLVASAAVQFARFGLEARHLRMYKVSADREAGAFRQIVGGRVQKGGEAGKQATADFAELVQLGESVHRALLRRGVGAPLPD